MRAVTVELSNKLFSPNGQKLSTQFCRDQKSALPLFDLTYYPCRRGTGDFSSQPIALQQWRPVELRILTNDPISEQGCLFSI